MKFIMILFMIIFAVITIIGFGIGFWLCNEGIPCASLMWFFGGVLGLSGECILVREVFLY